MLVPKICFPDDINANPENYEEFIEVKVVQDDDGHNYVIPAVSYEKFSNWLEMDPWYQDEEKEEIRVKLDKYFENYRTGGDISVRLFAKIGYELESEF